MKRIPLRNKLGKVIKYALVDDEDFRIVGGVRWYKSKNYTSKIAWSKTNKRPFNVLLHRIIMWCPDGYEIDHIDGNTFNCQKSNLRICLPGENKKNIKRSSRNTTGVKGVYRDKNYRNKWTATICVDGKKIRGGAFDTRKEAAACYAELSKKYHGVFGKIK